jgi:threonine dehydratase
MENGAAMIESLKAGKIVPINEVATLADALGGGLGTENVHTFEMTRRTIDESLMLSEFEIADAMRVLFTEDRIVAEGGGAVGVGALLSNRLTLNDGPTAIVISGCNVDMKRFLEIIR